MLEESIILYKEICKSFTGNGKGEIIEIENALDIIATMSDTPPTHILVDGYQMAAIVNAIYKDIGSRFYVVRDPEEYNGVIVYSYINKRTGALLLFELSREKTDYLTILSKELSFTDRAIIATLSKQIIPIPDGVTSSIDDGAINANALNNAFQWKRGPYYPPVSSSIPGTMLPPANPPTLTKKVKEEPDFILDPVRQIIFEE